MTDAPDPPPPARRKAYKIAGPQTWALARELYLAGLPASEVAARLGVSEHNLRKKATREGWSRRAHAELVLDLRLPKLGGDRRPASAFAASTLAAGALAASDPPDAADDALPFEVEADPAEAADALARRAAGAALAGRVEAAQGLLKAAEGLRRAAQASAVAPGWDDAARWDDAEPHPQDERRWRHVGAEADAPGWAEPPADPRDRRPCDSPAVASMPWTDARPPCTAGTCYVRASEATIEGALAHLAVLFEEQPDKASARAQGDAEHLAERLGRLAASGLPEQARTLYAAGWAAGLLERPDRSGTAAGGTAREGAGSGAVPFPPLEPEA